MPERSGADNDEPDRGYRRFRAAVTINPAYSRKIRTVVHPATSYGQLLSLPQLISKLPRNRAAMRSSQTYFLPLISTIVPRSNKRGHATVSRRPQILAPEAAMQGVSSV